MPKVVVVYLSTSANTKAMTDSIVEGVQSRNIDTVAMNFHEIKIEDLKAAVAIAIGSSTFPTKGLWNELRKEDHFEYEEISVTSPEGIDYLKKYALHAVPVTLIEDKVAFLGLPDREKAIDAVRRIICILLKFKGKSP